MPPRPDKVASNTENQVATSPVLPPPPLPREPVKEEESKELKPKLLFLSRIGAAPNSTQLKHITVVEKKEKVLTPEQKAFFDRLEKVRQAMQNGGDEEEVVSDEENDFNWDDNNKNKPSAQGFKK